YTPGFFAKHFLKDLRIALDSAKDMGIHLPATEKAEELYQTMVDEFKLGNDGTQGLIGCIIFRTDNVKFFCITVLLLFYPFLRQNKRDGPQRQSNYRKDTISMDNNIKLLLGITDTNLTIDTIYQYTLYIEKKIIKNSKALLCHLYLSYPIYCPNCKALMLHNGTKVVNNIHLSSAGKKLVLSIRKQKYLCPECKKTATAKFKDT